MVSMDSLVLVGYPVLALGIFAVYVYVDAPAHGMDRTKWAAIAFFVPLFGIFAYLLERSERNDDDDREAFEDGVFEIHESRADDTRLVSGTAEDDPEDNAPEDRR